MESARPEGGDRRSPGEHKRRNVLSVRFADGELAEVPQCGRAHRDGDVGVGWEAGHRRGRAPDRAARLAVPRGHD